MMRGKLNWYVIGALALGSILNLGARPANAQGIAEKVEVCAGCHGADGGGGAKARSVVDPSYLALVSDQHLRTTVIAGRADVGMPDWRGQIAGRTLAPQEISDVVAWLARKRMPVPGRAGGV